MIVYLMTALTMNKSAAKKVTKNNWSIFKIRASIKSATILHIFILNKKIMIENIVKSNILLLFLFMPIIMLTVTKLF